ncbi:hypothetical protein C1O63_0190 [Dehalococcoides mccartyi]|nr:hypothetical protein C1O63_0190 [Dehalococcoides mccartyi]
MKINSLPAKSAVIFAVIISFQTETALYIFLNRLVNYLIKKPCRLFPHGFYRLYFQRN